MMIGALKTKNNEIPMRANGMLKLGLLMKRRTKKKPDATD